MADPLKFVFRPGSAALDQLDGLNRLDQLGLNISVFNNFLKNFFTKTFFELHELFA